MNLLLYIFSTLFLCQFYTLLLIDPVTHCRCIASGGPSSLWLPAAEEHADKDPYARPQRGYAGNALRKLQSPVHPEHDAHGGAGEELQVSGVRMHTDAVWLFVWLVGWLNTDVRYVLGWLRWMFTQIVLFFVCVWVWIWVSVCVRHTERWARQIFFSHWPLLAPRRKDTALRKTKRYVYLTYLIIYSQSHRAHLFIPHSSWGR